MSVEGKHHNWLSILSYIIANVINLLNYYKDCIVVCTRNNIVPVLSCVETPYIISTQ